MAPSAHSKASTPSWQDVTPQALWPCKLMLHLSYGDMGGTLVWAYIWQRASDGMYTWRVMLNPQDDSPSNYTTRWSYDTLSDCWHWLQDTLYDVCGPVALSFPAPSSFGRLSDASQEGQEGHNA